MPKVGPLLALVAGLLSAALVRAQGPGDYGFAGPKVHGNARMSGYVKVVGHKHVDAEGVPISGTKIEVTSKIIGELKGSAPYANMRIKRAELRAGGELMARWDLDNVNDRVGAIEVGAGTGNLMGGGEEQGLGGGGGIEPVDPDTDWQLFDLEILGLASRFASTHFADGTLLPVQLKVWWQVIGPGMNVWEDPPAAVNPVVAEVKPLVYNKLQTLGTNVRLEDSIFVGDTHFAATSNKTTGAATTALTNNHSSSPGATALAETKLSILTRATESTAVSAMVHGTPPGIHSSNGSEVILFTSSANGSNLASSVHLRMPPPLVQAPPYNLVGYWACQTINLSNPGSSASVAAYHIPSVGAVDQAYIGFNKDVSLDVYSSSAWNSYGASTDPDPDIGLPTHDLGDHADLFWLRVAQGWTIFDALEEANETYFPTHYEGVDELPTKLPMIYVGDKRTNLINVYLSQAEYDALVSDNKDTAVWWISL